MGAALWVRSRAAGAGRGLLSYALSAVQSSPWPLTWLDLRPGWVQGRRWLCVGGELSVCPGASLRTRCPSGALEEVELQVFPDATVDDEIGDGQVCDCVHCMWACGGVPGCGAGWVTGSFALRMGEGSSCRPQRPRTVSPACRTWPSCWISWPRRTRISGCCRPSCRWAPVGRGGRGLPS